MADQNTRKMTTQTYFQVKSSMPIITYHMLLQEIIKRINKESDANQASAFIIIKISSICPRILKSSLIRHSRNLGEN